MLEAHRAHAEITKDLSFGRLAFSAPQDHYELLTMIYPEMQSPDAEIKTKFYKSIGNLELFQPYLINPKERLNAR